MWREQLVSASVRQPEGDTGSSALRMSFHSIAAVQVVSVMVQQDKLAPVQCRSVERSAMRPLFIVDNTEVRTCQS